MRPRQISRRVLYDGRIIRTELDRVRLPNGRRATLEIVRHRGSVVLIPQPSPSKVILVRQYRYAIDKWIWELPAGSLERGERPLASARRECEEEVGLSPGRIRRLMSLYPTPGFCDEIMHFYVCTDLRPLAHPVEQDVDELLQARVFTLKEARRLQRTGQIVDMKTVIGLGLVRS
jgi:ADP-ribose pyrophosphatase